MADIIKAVDLFCGAGGTTAGLSMACASRGLSLDLLAINHWKIAINTHRLNHPTLRHLHANADNVDPRKVIRSGKLDLMVASPECIHHSIARGGRAVCDQSRASAWHVLHWAETLQIDSILIENVPRFKAWGPLGTNNQPLKSRKGETYQAFLNALRSLDYVVEDRILNAADYGDPTTRRRLFIQARRGRHPIQWPKPTHSADGAAGETWRPAREIIDWSIPGKSIFGRKRPLRPATLRRIETGLRKFGGEAAKPFLVILRGASKVRALDQPIPTITAGGGHFGLVEPFLVQYHGNHKGKEDGHKRVHPLSDPCPTLDCANRFGLVEPFILGQQSGAAPRSVDDPLPTIATAGAISLIQPFLVKYYGNSSASSINEPLDTITTKDRFGLVQPVYLDILFRMLQPHELAAAMSLEDYRFVGTKTEQVKQIGNAVPKQVAAALCGEMLKNN